MCNYLSNATNVAMNKTHFKVWRFVITWFLDEPILKEKPLWCGRFQSIFSIRKKKNIGNHCFTKQKSTWSHYDGAIFMLCTFQKLNIKIKLAACTINKYNVQREPYAVPESHSIFDCTSLQCPAQGQAHRIYQSELVGMFLPWASAHIRSLDHL